MQRLRNFRESQRLQALARISNEDDPMIQKTQRFLLSKEMKQKIYEKVWTFRKRNKLKLRRSSTKK